MDQVGRGRSLTGTGVGGAIHGDPTGARVATRENTPADGPVLVDVRARRADVVERLLDLGVTPRTLATLLPEWEELIGTVAANRTR